MIDVNLRKLKISLKINKNQNKQKTQMVLIQPTLRFVKAKLVFKKVWNSNFVLLWTCLFGMVGLKNR